MLHRSTTCAAALTLALVCAAPAGCAGNAPDGPTHAFTVTTEDGVEIARTTGGPKYDGEIFRYEKVLGIRPDPEVEESFLYSPQWVTMSDDGRIFVSDMGDEQVVVFDTNGGYLYRIGRKGQGPGEFQAISYVEVDDDVLTVVDLRRLHRFELDGTLIATDTLPLPAQRLIRDGRWWRLADRNIVIFNLADRSEPASAATAEMYLVDPEGNVLASAASPWVPTGEYLEQEGSRPIWLPYAFTGRPWGDFSPELGFFLTDPPASQVLVYGLDGALSRRVVIEPPPLAVTDADRAWRQEQLEERVRQADEGASESNREWARAQRDNPRFTDPKHWWSRPIVDDRGFLWLWLHNARNLPDEADRWVVVSPDGEYLGQTTTPGWAQPHRGYLLTVLEDATSGERIPTVYRIQPAVEGLTY